jgi:hypothetical protein
MKTPTRCSDCGLKTDNLVKCSKERCSNQLCPECVVRYSGKHCNNCYVSRDVQAARPVLVHR